jgi:hypothetical protein
MRLCFLARNIAEKWRSEGDRHMVSIMNRRFFRALVHLLIAGQLLLSAPIVPAMSGASAMGSSGVHCADSMPDPAAADACPCCPEGETSTAACLSACAASVGAISTLELPTVSLTAAPVPLFPFVHVARAVDPPLKPPPIV